MGKKIKMILKQYRIIVNTKSGLEPEKASGKREVRADGEREMRNEKWDGISDMHAARRS
jgi:hypothetical protein